MKGPILGICLVLCAFLCACQAKTDSGNVPEKAEHIMEPAVAEGQELFMLSDSEEEAKKVAETYGIKLVDFSHGVATFHTEESPSTVIRQGREKGWPELSLNLVETLIEPGTPDVVEKQKIN